MGLPRAAVTCVRPDGPAATARSPEFNTPTASFTERPMRGLFFSSFSKNDQP